MGREPYRVVLSSTWLIVHPPQEPWSGTQTLRPKAEPGQLTKLYGLDRPAGAGVWFPCCDCESEVHVHVVSHGCAPDRFATDANVGAPGSSGTRAARATKLMA